MKAPPIFVIVKRTKFHNPCVSWWFDEQQAHDIAKKLNAVIESEYVYQVEEVPAGEIPT